MTDDQLRAMARRVNQHLFDEVRCFDEREYRVLGRTIGNADEMDDSIAAILREEMGLAGELQTGWTYSTGTVQGDDPTKSFVATTDAMQQSIARTIEGH